MIETFPGNQRSASKADELNVARRGVTWQEELLLGPLGTDRV